ncbi:MAG: hypothetical protein ABIK32_07420 [Chloroflexota bacterium]|nr:hypothetical protein [Chloroflexota bacterium]
MVDTSNKFEPEVDEAEQIFHEYRQGISQAIDKVRAKLLDRAKQEARDIVAKADGEATNIVRIAQHKVDIILTQANSRAEKIIKDAEETIKKEARNRTRKEEERLIMEAKSQSERIITAAREAAEKVSGKILDDTKKEADISIKRLTEDSKREADGLVKSASEIKNRAEIEANLIKKKAEEETGHIIHNAREQARRDVEKELTTIIEKARQEAEDILKNARDQAIIERDNLVAEFVEEATKLAEFEKIKILSEAKSKAEYVVREIKNRLNAEMEKSSLLITGAQQKLTSIMTEISDQITEEQFDIDISVNVDVPVEEVDADFAKEVQEKMFFKKIEDEERSYEGRLELDLLAPIDAKQKNALEELLTQVPDLHLISNGGSSDGSNWLEIELNKPMPLVSILKQMPLVRQVAAHGNNILVALKLGSKDS